MTSPTSTQAITVFVTGATGTIGREVVKALAAKPGVTVKVGVRKESFGKLPQQKNIVPVEFDWDAPATYGSLAGAERAFLLTPIVPESQELVAAFAAAAKKAGVKHIVKLSSAGADQEKPIRLAGNHRKGELAIEQTGLAFTHLRPGMFADNLANYWPPQKDGNIYMPFGTGKLALIDARDVAAVAAAALTEDGHAGKAYELSGPTAVGMDEIAADISKATGRTVRYVDVSEEEAAEAMAKAGMPEWIVRDFGELYGIGKQGWLAGVTDTVEKITGNKPRTFAEFAKDHANAWK